MTRPGEHFALTMGTFWSLLGIVQPQSLAIDNQLAIAADDCYTRVSIGTRLPASFLTLRVGTVDDCEAECSRRRSSCNAFSIGIDLKGNATCTLGANPPKIEDLQPDPDYDVYVRSQRTPNCEFDRIYKLESGIRNAARNQSVRDFGSGLLRPIVPNVFQPSRSGNGGTPADKSRYESYFTSADDDRRISDIVKNKNRRPIADDLVGYSGQAVFQNDNGRYSPAFVDEGGTYPWNKGTPAQEHAGNDAFSYLRPIVVGEHRFSPGADSFAREPIIGHGGFNDDFSKRANLKGFYAHVPGYEFDVDHGAEKFGRFLGDYEDGERSGDFPPTDKFRLNEEIRNDGNDGWVAVNLRQNKFTYHGPRNLSAHEHRVPGFLEFTGKLHRNFGDNRSKDRLAYNFTHFPGFSTDYFDEFYNANYQFGDRINHKNKPCYRRLLSGKKIRETHVRRALECRTIDDCHRACDYEKLFDCTGFNYRRVGHGPRGFCELTSTPYPRIDVHRDFAADPRCDFYEKDLNCRPDVRGPSSRPAWSYDYASSVGPLSRPFPSSKPDARPYDPEGRYPVELPRPPDYYPRGPSTVPHHDRTPTYDPSYEPNDPYHRRPYLPDRTHTESPYYPTRPDDRHRPDRIHPSRPGSNDFYHGGYGRPYPTPPYTDRRMDYDPYHHDIGTNEVGPYAPGHRKDPNRYWGTYGGVYGSSYPYDTNTVSNFDTKNLSYQPGRPEQHQPPRPYENDHFYGEFYNYGGAFGYGGNYAPTYKDLIYGGTGEDQECSIRAGAGFKLGRAIVRKSFLTPNLDQCESLCVTEKSFLCMTFAYRYNVAATDPTDNCLLSDIPYRDLNFYTDLVPDHDYDIYAVIGDIKTCNARKRSNEHPPDECFWRVRSGFGMPTDVTRKTMIVEGIGDCQIECTVTQDFTCRSFAFRYDPRGERRNRVSPNCYLSDWPSQEINPANMPDVDDAELYERGSFGRGCEPYSLASFHTGKLAGEKPSHGNDGCYSGYHRPCKLTPYAVLVATHAESEADCREKCTRMRTKDSTPCMSFSFRVAGSGRDENCLLSDVPIRDLRPGLDYMYDDGHVLYSWRDRDPGCYVSSHHVDDDHVHGVPSYGLGRPLPPGPPYVPEVGPGHGYGPDTGLGTPSTEPGYSYGPPRRPSGGGHGYGTVGDDGSGGYGYGYGIGTRPLDPDRPDPIAPSYNSGGIKPDVPRPAYEPEGQRPYGGGYGYGVRPLDPDRPDPHRPIGGQNDYGGWTDSSPAYRPSIPYPDDFYTFQHYTVNGYPCKRGSRCEKNKLTGFWSCETEGGAFGSWDYCCAPNNRCGYSRGYNYPWCYVGPSEDQWRPCSEKYYPYLPSPRPLCRRPSYHYRDNNNNNDDDRRYYVDSSPLPDYSARHWPVIYVHGVSPPNCTDSIASAAGNPARRLNNDNNSNDESNPARSRNSTRAGPDRQRQTRRRRLRARTVAEIVPSASTPVAEIVPSAPTPVDEAKTKRDQRLDEDRANAANRTNVRAMTNDTDSRPPGVDGNRTIVLPAKTIGAQIRTAGTRAGKVERVVKQPSAREPFRYRAENATGSARA